MNKFAIAAAVTLFAQAGAVFAKPAPTLPRPVVHLPSPIYPVIHLPSTRGAIAQPLPGLVHYDRLVHGCRGAQCGPNQ